MREKSASSAMPVGFISLKSTANLSTRSSKDQFSRRCRRAKMVHSTQRSGLCGIPHEMKSL